MNNDSDSTDRIDRRSKLNREILLLDLPNSEQDDRRNYYEILQSVKSYERELQDFQMEILMISFQLSTLIVKLNVAKRAMLNLKY